jgi:hypothetical protein
MTMSPMTWASIAPGIGHNSEISPTAMAINRLRSDLCITATIVIVRKDKWQVKRDFWKLGGLGPPMAGQLCLPDLALGHQDRARNEECNPTWPV